MDAASLERCQCGRARSLGSGTVTAAGQSARRAHTLVTAQHTPPPPEPPPRPMSVARFQAARLTRIPLAGGTQETLLSEVGPVLLRFVSTVDACALRLVCREFLVAVIEHPWEDRDTVILGSIGAWRACFPRARCANVQMWVYGDEGETEVRDAPVVDADFVHFEGLWELNMAGCIDVTDAAFVHLRGIRTLNMSECSQPAITDAAFAYLAGVKRLGMWDCNQATITDAAFAHLHGIHLLNMGRCDQLTDAAFVHLRGIHTLFMCRCDQPAITDAAFVHLRGVSTLTMDLCTQDTITGATFSHLKGIFALGMSGCSEALVEAAESLGLKVYPDEISEWGCMDDLNLETELEAVEVEEDSGDE
jgi:hypothetical protein